MKKTLMAAFAVAALFTACSAHHETEDPTGTWTSAAPISVTKGVADATTATKTLTIDFAAPVGDAAGELTYTADYDVTAPYVTDEGTTESRSYKVTASIKGTWAQEKGEHDDYLLTFDQNTLTVNGTDAPELGPVTDEFMTSLTTFTSIEDVEVSNDGTHMSFETDHPDVTYHFVKK